MLRSIPKASQLIRWSRNYFGRVIGDESAGTGDQIRAARLRLFMGLGLLSTGFYALHDYSLGSYWTAGLHLTGFLVMAVSGRWLRGPKQFGTVSHLLVTVLTVVLGLIPLWDGHIYAPGLWALVLVSVSAPFLFPSRVVVRYSLFGVAMILVNLALGPYFDHLERVTQTTEQWLQLRLIMLMMFGGLIVIGAFSSIRARQAILQQTQALRERAQEENVAQRSKSVFLEATSYQLQIPVAGLARQGQQLQASEAGPGAFDIIVQNTSRLANMLASVSDLARLEAGSVELREAPFSMGVLFDLLHRQFEERAKQKGLSFRISDGFGPVRLLGDADRIYQVLASLVDNAIRFSDTGQIELRAESEASKDTPSSELRALMIQVSDQGIGMDAAQLERLFGNFEQVHEDAELQRGGCGLGLAVSQRLVRLMGGALEVESRVGQGTTFRCRLQLALAQSEQSETDLSAVLGFDFFKDLPLDLAHLPKEGASAQVQGDSELGGFVKVVAPALLLMILRAFIWQDYSAAIVQAACFAGLVASATSSVRKILGSGAWVIFTLGLAFSVAWQSILDGSIHSEALWLVALPPIIAAYAFGLRSALGAMVAAAGLIGVIGLDLLPKGAFELGQDSILLTLANRLAFVLAFVGSTVLITGGSRAKLLAMRKHQVSVRELSLAAQRANQEKSRFFLRIAEEFGAPLRAILEAAAAASRRGPVAPEQMRLLDQVDRSARAIFCLLDRTLLNAGAASNGAPQLNEAFDMRRLLEDVGLLVSGELESREIELVVEDAMVAPIVVGDGPRVLELLTLLMSYTLSAACSGPLMISVKDSLRAKVQQQVLSVEIKSRVGRVDASLGGPLQSQRENAWARALDLADSLGATLQAFDTEAYERRVLLELSFEASARAKAA